MLVGIGAMTEGSRRNNHDGGVDLFHLSNILGHSNLMTTMIYLRVNSDAKRAAWERGVPRF